jgi:YidC/Oxa1 family membrane protein insertase
MIEKVPSFKEGGAFWFTDLTTPDELYILPVLISMAFAADEVCILSEALNILSVIV